MSDREWTNENWDVPKEKKKNCAAVESDRWAEPNRTGVNKDWRSGGTLKRNKYSDFEEKMFYVYLSIIWILVVLPALINIPVL